MTDRRYRSNKGLWRASLLLPALLPIGGVAIANPLVWYDIEASNFSEDVEGVISVAADPVDVAASAWDRVLLPDQEEHGMWVYGDRTGRVRTFARTGAADAPSFSRSGYAMIVWSGTYIRDSSPVSFTINPSRLAVLAQSPGPSELKTVSGNPRLPFAEMYFDVRVSSPRWRGRSEYEYALVLEYEAKMEGIVPDLRVDHLKAYGVQGFLRGTPHPFLQLLEEEPTWFQDCYNLSGEVTCVKLQTGLKFSNEAPYEEAIDLTAYGIEIGDEYSVSYMMWVQAGSEAGAEQYAEAILGDPLDAGIGGFTLNTTHLLADDARSQICSKASDPFRFTVDGSTVTDGRTGLIWQRCPVGTALDDNGTPQDPSDDLCPVTPGAELDWQGALALSATESTGGFDDWRAPNVKELESLALDTCALPAIDQTAFPPVGGSSETYWSSTPAADAGQAWIVDFASGDFMPRDRSGTAYLRAVRQELGQPRAPTTEISVADAETVEGDDGVTPLGFALSLSPPPADPVTVSYSLSPLTATEGQDYEPPAGTLVISAGASHAVIELPIVGDLETEPDEIVGLTLDAVVGNAWIGRGRAAGVILDDEPQPTAADLVVSEGAGSLEFVVRLPAPAEAPLTIDYATADGTAAAGADYTASLGSVLVNIGEERATIVVPIANDAAWENDETVMLEVTAQGRAPMTATGTILDDDVPRTYQALNDTGVDNCASQNDALLACPQPGFPNQDGEIGLDATNPGSADGLNGFSFTKLDATGTALADQTQPYSVQPWSCVVDEVTGLMWEVKSDDPSDLRYYDWTYTWFDSDGVNDGGDPGTENAGMCVDAASCDAEKYVAAVNAAALCGFSDWRLPRVDEAYTIARTATPDADAIRGLDSRYFPHNYSTSSTGFDGYSYWTSDTFAQDSAWAWSIKYRAPSTNMSFGPKSTALRLRLVR